MNQSKSGISDRDQEKIMTLVGAILPQAKIILFGSRARGKYHKGSDIDIALDTGSRIDFRDLSEIRDVLAATNILLIIDVVDLHQAPPELRIFIEKEGIPWN